MIAVLVFAFMLLGSSARAQQWGLSTNVVDLLNMGTLNAELSYGCGRHWSVVADVKYNPFQYASGTENQVQHRQQLYALGARWWPWHIQSGWWFAGKAQYQEYNMGGLVSAKTEEGDAYGGGLTAGYTHMLSPHLNLEFGLGFWNGYKKYVVYACPHCGAKLESGEKYFFAPNDVMLSLAFVF